MYGNPDFEVFRHADRLHAGVVQRRTPGPGPSARRLAGCRRGRAPLTSGQAVRWARRPRWPEGLPCRVARRRCAGGLEAGSPRPLALAPRSHLGGPEGEGSGVPLPHGGHQHHDLAWLMVGTAAWPVAARGQQAETPAVGFLRSTPSEPFTHLERSHRGQLAWAVTRDVRSSDPSTRATTPPTSLSRTNLTACQRRCLGHRSSAEPDPALRQAYRLLRGYEWPRAARIGAGRTPRTAAVRRARAPRPRTSHPGSKWQRTG